MRIRYDRGKIIRGRLPEGKHLRGMRLPLLHAFLHLKKGRDYLLAAFEKIKRYHIIFNNS